jgi:hypothetical protein
MSLKQRFLTSIERLRMKKIVDAGDTLPAAETFKPSASRFLLGGLGDSRHMYSLNNDWQVDSHRKVDFSSAKGIVIAADPAQDLVRRIDHTTSDRVQLAELASDIGEVLLAVKTKARSGLTQLFGRKASADSIEEGETLKAVQAIQERGWWLCTPVNRLQELDPSVRVLPLTSVLLKLLEAHSRSPGHQMDSGATVVVLVFPGAAQVKDYQIVCLATFTAAGHLEGLDFVPGSGLTVQQVISNYCSVRKLSADGVWPQERLILASTTDPQVKKWLSGADAYPRHQLIMGVPAKKAGSFGMRISVVALSAVASYSAFAHWQLTQIQSDIEKANTEQMQTRAQAIAAVRERSLGHVLSHTGLNTQRAIDMAVKAWLPGTLVEMKASTDRATFTVNAPLGNGDKDGDQSGDRSYGDSAAAALVNAPAPPGCSASATQINAALNQLVITYECTLQNPELARMRAAGF